MALLKPRGNVLFLLLFMLLSICRLAAEYLGYQRILPPALLLMWLSLSIGVIFTLYDMRELHAYNVVSECLQFKFGCGDLSIAKLLVVLIVGVSAMCAAGDMWIRWDTAHLNWAVHYPWYFQLLLSVGSSLYLLFILFQGQSEGSSAINILVGASNSKSLITGSTSLVVYTAGLFCSATACPFV